MGLMVGLTGGIASGKSTVTEFLSDSGVPIIDTDVLSRELVAPGQPALAAIVRLFGQIILTADGWLDRSALRRIIFDDADARSQLEAILHPAIRHLAEQRARVAAVQSPYVLVVVPLLAEPQVKPHYGWLDMVIGIRTTPALQQARLLMRPGIDATLAKQILAAQSTDAERAPMIDEWLDNHSDLAQLKSQVQQLHQRLQARSAS